MKPPTKEQAGTMKRIKQDAKRNPYLEHNEFAKVKEDIWTEAFQAGRASAIKNIKDVANCNYEEGKKEMLLKVLEIIDNFNFEDYNPADNELHYDTDEAIKELKAQLQALPQSPNKSENIISGSNSCLSVKNNIFGKQVQTGSDTQSQPSNNSNRKLKKVVPSQDKIEDTHSQQVTSKNPSNFPADTSHQKQETKP